MTVLITGASKGIGKELAYEFASQGHDLVLLARSKDLLEKLKEDIEAKYKVNVSLYDFDLTCADARESFLFNFKEDIEILVNNAGFGDFAFFPEADIQKNLAMIDLNIKALVHFCHFFANRFLRQKDHGKSYKILNIASTAAFCPGPSMATYFATKAFVLSFSNALYAELNEHGIHVHCFCPGPTHSEFAKTANIENAIAFQLAMDTKEVAQIAYKELFTSKPVSIAGMQNKALIFMRRFMPTGLVAKMTKAVFSKSN